MFKECAILSYTELFPSCLLLVGLIRFSFPKLQAIEIFFPGSMSLNLVNIGNFQMGHIYKKMQLRRGTRRLLYIEIRISYIQIII
jgi:hypothetical protein